MEVLALIKFSFSLSSQANWTLPLLSIQRFHLWSHAFGVISQTQATHPVPVQNSIILTHISTVKFCVVAISSQAQPCNCWEASTVK